MITSQKRKINGTSDEPQKQISIIVPLFIPYLETFDPMLSKKYQPLHRTHRNNGQIITYHFYFMVYIKAKTLKKTQHHLRFRNKNFFQQLYHPSNTYIVKTFNNTFTLKSNFTSHFTFNDLYKDLIQTFKFSCQPHFSGIIILDLLKNITNHFGYFISGINNLNIDFLRNALSFQNATTLKYRSLPGITQLVIEYLGVDDTLICFSNLFNNIPLSILFNHCMTPQKGHHQTHLLTHYFIINQLIKVTQSLIKRQNLNHNLLNYRYPQFNFTLPIRDYPKIAACRLLNHNVRHNRYSPDTFKKVKITSSNYQQLWQLLETITPKLVHDTSSHIQIFPSLLILICTLAYLLTSNLSFNPINSICDSNQTSSLKAESNLTML